MSVFDDIIDTADKESNDLSLLEILITYLREWKLFIVSILLFVLLGFVYIKFATPVYKIETYLLIKENKGSTGNQNDLLKDLGLYSSAKVIDNEVQILKSNTILEEVITQLKLQVSYINTNRFKDNDVYKDQPFEVELVKPSVNVYSASLNIQLLNENEALLNGKKVLLNTIQNTDAGQIIVKTNPLSTKRYTSPLIVKFNDKEILLERYKDKLKIDPVSKQSSVLIISIEESIPQRGIDFLNKLVDEYNKQAIADKEKETSATLAFIEERLKVISNELGSVEKNVEQFKSSNQITNISSESQIFLESVKDNDAQLNKILIQLSVLKNLQNYLHNHQDQMTKVPSMLGVDDPTILALVSRLREVQTKKQNLLQTVPVTSPLVSTLIDEANSLDQALDASVQNLINGLQITKQQIQDKNKQYESDIKGVPSKERGLLDVMRKQEIQNNLFTYLLQKREETAMALASVVADSRTIDLARTSRYPVKPVKNVIYLSFFLIGLILPAIIIYFKGLLNFKVNRRSDIEKATNAPILAEISHSDEDSALIVSSKPRSMVAEQIRSLRTNLEFVLPNDAMKVILFTSSISGEGKSFVSLNLGASLAMAGKKVVILELDLRKPKLHSGLDIDNNAGLSNYLIGRADYKDILKIIAMQDNYYIITSGPIPPNPAELLVNGRIEELIEELKKEFDYIIMDAPPVGLVTDAQILGRHADLTLFIVRHNYTAKNHILNLNEFYKNKKFNNLNIILNSIDLQMGYGSSYGYGYGYGYGGGYYQETKKKWSSNLFKKKRKK